MFFEAILSTVQREIPVKDAAVIAGKSPCQIRRMIRSGRLARRGGDGERLRVSMAEVPMCRAQRLAVLAVLHEIATLLKH